MKAEISKAVRLLKLSADLYVELARSALSIIPGLQSSR